MRFEKMKVLVSYSLFLGAFLLSMHARKTIRPADHKDNYYYKTLGSFRSYFFTGWNLGLQISFLVTAILHEISKLLNFNLEIQKLLGRTRSFLFSTLLLPSTCLVITVFWGIWHVDRELIFPKAIDVFLPLWLNHVLHTFIAVPVIVEVLLPRKYHFVRFKKAALVIIAYLTVYQSLYFSIYLRYGIWLYPIYQYLNWLERIIFTLVQCAACMIYLKVGLAIQNMRRVKVSEKQN